MTSIEIDVSSEELVAISEAAEKMGITAEEFAALAIDFAAIDVFIEVNNPPQLKIVKKD